MICRVSSLGACATFCCCFAFSVWSSASSSAKLICVCRTCAAVGCGVSTWLGTRLHPAMARSIGVPHVVFINDAWKLTGPLAIASECGVRPLQHRGAPAAGSGRSPSARRAGSAAPRAGPATPGSTTPARTSRRASGDGRCSSAESVELSRERSVLK